MIGLQQKKIGHDPVKKHNHHNKGASSQHGSPIAEAASRYIPDKDVLEKSFAWPEKISLPNMVTTAILAASY